MQELFEDMGIALIQLAFGVAMAGVFYRLMQMVV